VLGELGPDDTISTAALVRDVILDTSKHSIEATHGGNYVLSHPVDDCLGEAAAHRRRGGERHSRFIGKHDCLEPNDVLHRALACPDNRRQAWGDCKVSGKTLTAQGWCRRFRRFGIDCGHGSEPRPRSRQWNSRSNGEFAGREKESQCRESFKPHGQPSWRPSAASFDLAPPPGRRFGRDLMPILWVLSGSHHEPTDPRPAPRQRPASPHWALTSPARGAAFPFRAHKWRVPRRFRCRHSLPRGSFQPG
jgi:hypothetical protein